MSRVLSAGHVFFGRKVPLQDYTRMQSVIQRLQPNLKVWPPSAGRIAQWREELGVFDPLVKRPSALDQRFEAFVTMDAADCDATYALHTKRIPVLYLKRETGEELSFTSEENHALLRVATCGSEEAQTAAIESFFTFPATAGRIFVVEGGDGSGKQTQVALLVRRLQEEGTPVSTLDYPHDKAKYGVLIREVLGGQRGNMRAVNPLMFAALYGVNREDHQPWLAYWILRGHNIVLDRYMTANFGHQASKFETDDERQSAIASLSAFEVDWLDLPAAHRVVYLNLPPVIAYRAMMTDTTRKALDEHEKAGLDYKNKVRSAFLWCCENLPGWMEVKCGDEVLETRTSRQEVHSQVWDQLQSQFVNRGSAS
jgi:dTMP kinase